MRARILIPALIVAAGLSTAAFGQGAPRVVVGDNPSLSGAPLYVALEKGYYREAGIDVQLEMSGTSSDMAVLLATNRLQVIGGALSAGFFNSLSKGLPIGLLMARATSPLGSDAPEPRSSFFSPSMKGNRAMAGMPSHQMTRLPASYRAAEVPPASDPW